MMLPKGESGNGVAQLDSYISEIEAANGVEPGSLCILPIVTETAASLFGMRSYSSVASPRLCGLFWGGEDLANDIGALENRHADGRYTAPYQLARALTLIGAAAAQVPAIDAVYTNFRDREGLRAEAGQALRDGFSAKVAIHPDQIAPIHEAFTPTTADIEKAQRVMAAFDAAPGIGAISLDGRMLDTPHYSSAQRVLARIEPFTRP